MNLLLTTLTHASVFQRYVDFLSIKIQYDCTSGQNLAQELQAIMVHSIVFLSYTATVLIVFYKTLNVSAFLGKLWKETSSLLRGEHQ